ncbi:MAG: hypothetical protein LUQ50_11705 [Methanospirillum sp.]|nr:hypothetical protein [Methanospirillum sp.]MDD1729720.1 hypothetical protein [Methanospirillum sp.]
MLYQITSKYHTDTYGVPLHPSNLSSVLLKELSYIRPDKLFVADISMIQYALGHVSDPILQTVVDTIISIIR